MIRLILRALNPPALILLVAFAVAIQTSLFAPSFLNYLQPDVILVAVIWCALKRPFTEGGLLTIVIANIAEIHSSVPQGLFLVSYMAIFLLVRASSRVFVMPNLTSLVLLTMAATVIVKLACLVLLTLLNAGQGHWRHTLLFMSPGVIVNGLLGLWAYRALDRFDWITYKNLRARQMMEDEYILEGEGL